MATAVLWSGTAQAVVMQRIESVRVRAARVSARARGESVRVARFSVADALLQYYWSVGTETGPILALKA